MAIDKKLLDILVCPTTKVPVKLLAKDRLDILNSCINGGAILRIGGETVQTVLTQALITTDGRTIYPIDDGIPIMLEEQGITANQVPGW